MTDSIRVGLVGASWWGDYLLPMLQSHPQAVAQAICGRTRSRAEEMAKKYHIPQVFTDYREMIEKGGLQAIIVATPDDVHYPMVMDALDAGLHVVCEKPMTLSVPDAKAMYEKARSAGVKNMVYYTWHWMSHYRFIKQLLDEGYIGRCYDFHLRWSADYWRNPEYQWHFDRQRAQGVLSDLGSHLIHFARWYMGDIVRVSAQLSTFVKRPGLDGKPSDSANDTATLLVEFANGAQGSIVTSSVVLDDGQNMIWHGDSGTLKSEFTFGTSSIVGKRQNEKDFAALTVPDKFWENGDKTDIYSVYRTQSVGMRYFIDAILEDKPVYPDFYEGYKVQQVISAALESQEKSSWVSVG